MNTGRNVECQNWECGWKGTKTDCALIAPHELGERLMPGEEMPAGDCPECGCFAMLTKKPNPTEGPAVRLGTTTEPGLATGFAHKSPAEGAAEVMRLLGNTHRYVVEDTDSNSCRVPIYRQSDQKGAKPRAYLRFDAA